MYILYVTIAIILTILLLLVSSIKPIHSRFSLFELERRSETGDKEFGRILSRERLLGDIISLQYTVINLLLVGVTIFYILAFGWLVGILVTLLLVIIFRPTTRIKFINLLAMKIYGRIEKPLLGFIKKHKYIIKIFRGVSVNNLLHVNKIESRQELQWLLNDSGNVLSSNEKNLIIHGLEFNNQSISTIMTPQSDIISINKSDFLGPLMLNDLHKVGHSRLPVINADINHIIGILNLKSLLTLDTKKSMTAEKAMEQKVFYIRSDQTLYQGLVAFLQTKSHLIIVVNESKETIGVLTLQDIIESLFGHKIVDEFDAYDDLRAVVGRK